MLFPISPKTLVPYARVLARAVVALVAGGAATLAWSADGDTTPPRGAVSDHRLIEEVVVTARRREERQQDIAISLTSVAGPELEARQVLAMDQLGSIVPNLQFDAVAPSSGSSSAGQMFIRGIGQADFTPVTDPGVALYLDNVYIARSPGNVFDVIDVERIEVLRGPPGHALRPQLDRWRDQGAQCPAGAGRAIRRRAPAPGQRRAALPCP
jgi:iron complex outermembrane receptor protein